MARTPRASVLPPIRCNSDELLRIKENAARSPHSSLSAYVREIAMNGAIIQRDSIGDKHLLLSLGQIGNNLNQSVRALNELAMSADAVGDPKLAAQVRTALDEVSPVLAQVQTVMEALIE